MKNIKSLFLILPFALTACTTTTQECDPSIQDPGFFDKLGCVVSGSYEKRSQAKLQEIKDLRELNHDISQQVIAIENERSALIADRAARYKAIDELNERIYALESTLKSKNALNASLKSKLESLKQSSASVRNMSESESIMEKQEKLKKLEQRYNELLSAMSSEF